MAGGVNTGAAESMNQQSTEGPLQRGGVALQAGDLVRIQRKAIEHISGAVQLWLWSESLQDDVSITGDDLGLVVGCLRVDGEEFLEVAWGGWGVESITISSGALLESC